VTAEPADGEPEFSNAVGSTQWLGSLNARQRAREGVPDDVCRVYSNVSYTIYYREMGY
jgi:hypothetical protein